ncbi:tRNA (guanosine(37)-N1)-methyltransferase TrmD [Lentilactobacillus otakiensis]|uniref:tRNA (guanine-N(1)-)-methyltransferase n=1 Tax=Lentilactobacillus otakiensis DSM 19908 = JCM 15040 TaxID=1423780 RepID=S4NID8_9LACO|nr:tRNA (guanosine(37)-N1)-methyltransferase TrmD [Lentilactobacillus otakiensis]MBZ3776720.1 tRNA (guanosine(37)-N1)-methyltransferase TrmD [Lentilactobacillus otakiensis]MDV3519061.1 tRNA (guanosine(37)-N1)-methyltransferase TrmD [Lentilactobacillus otakiensis]GAD15771.1 tRNA (guanine-N(1)-)-methyltransferase [Lentilactobacillus otakiensis DSM 19908 = JCM 15040]
MRIDVLSLFPEMFSVPMHDSIIGKAIENHIIDLDVTNFREFTTDKHRHVDDYPFGGGAGMLLQAQPILDAYDHTRKTAKAAGYPQGKVILMDPAGKQFKQHDAEILSHDDHLTFICGHYEGYDERIRSIVTDEYSLGDFVLTGGELPAMVMIDAITRLIPGVLGNNQSSVEESFSTGLLEEPQYTRPAEFRGMKVPEVLMNGDHKKIALWNQKEALRRTYLRRPDLIDHHNLTSTQKKLFADVRIEEEEKQAAKDADKKKTFTDKD